MRNLRNNMRILRSDRGDTIIEVLISIAVLSTILVGAYVSVDRANLIIRDSQERLKALNIGQTQIESLVSWYKTNSSSTNYCPQQLIGSKNCAQSNFCINTSSITAETSSNCFIASNNTLSSPQAKSTSTTNQPPFYYSLNMTATPVNNLPVAQYGTSSCLINNVYTYQITIDWSSLLGGRSSVTLYYRPSVLPTC